MDLSIQNIVALYIKIAPEQITDQTIIDRSAVSSSILLHRMYAHLAKEGFVVNNYWEIKNYGMLSERLSGIQMRSSAVVLPQVTTTNTTSFTSDMHNATVGIDIEQITMMPPVNDYREDAFYSMNFAQSEIAYCILQPNPLASFTGLFAAKEAIVKADNNFLDQPFHTIVIDHLPNGKPVHPHFSLSISHSHDFAVAVALVVKAKNPPNSMPLHAEDKLKPTQSLHLLYIIAVSALLLSLILLVFSILD